jgi:hypothetical protein
VVIVSYQVFRQNAAEPKNPHRRMADTLDSPLRELHLYREIEDRRKFPAEFEQHNANAVKERRLKCYLRQYRRDELLSIEIQPARGNRRREIYNVTVDTLIKKRYSYVSHFALSSEEWVVSGVGVLVYPRVTLLGVLKAS